MIEIESVVGKEIRIDTIKDDFNLLRRASETADAAKPWVKQYQPQPIHAELANYAFESQESYLNQNLRTNTCCSGRKYHSV